MVKDLHFELSVKAPTPSIAEYYFFHLLSMMV
jgi:hypothetical protein